MSISANSFVQRAGIAALSREGDEAEAIALAEEHKADIVLAGEMAVREAGWNL